MNPASPVPPSAFRRTGRLTAGMAASAAALLLGTALAPAAAADENSSDNLRHIANVPLEAPVDSVGSDLAFTGDYAIDGNYNGFIVYDISDPESPQVASRVLCEGGQG
ncbi:hypothetical protein LP52_25290, partial [Streptomonospora alba]